MFKFIIAALFIALAPALAYADGRQEVYYYGAPAPNSPPPPSYTSPTYQPYSTASQSQNTSSYRSTYNWSGFYAGATIGYGDGTSRRDFANSGFRGQGTTTGDFDVSGVIGGGTLGYNFQTAGFVLGVEGDMSGTGVSGSKACPGFSYTCHTDNEWLATIRPRVGYPVYGFMPYITGGLAVGQEHVYSRSFFANAPVSDYTSVQPGWTAGGGIELPIVDHFTLKAEYLYVNLGDADGPASNGAPSTVHFDESLGRVGVNYLF